MYYTMKDQIRTVTPKN